MKIPIRLFIFAALVALEIFFYLELRSAYFAEDGPDLNKTPLLFAAMLLTALPIGLIFAGSLLPLIGEFFGNLLFNPNDSLPDPHAAPRKKLERGDFTGAIDEYRQCYENNPDDLSAINEVTAIFCEKLHDPASATSTLHSVLQKEQNPDKRAFLKFRLASVLRDYCNDSTGAGKVLQEIIFELADTPHAIRARHELNQLSHS